MPDFDWENLKAVLAVVRTGRLTAAAKRLRIDHSTLSRRICSLETALGTKLFDRRTGGYTLTREGELLIEEAESIENIAVRIQSRLDNTAPKLTGCIRIGIPEGFGTYFLAPRLSLLTGQHPELRVEVVASPSMFSLSKREADLAITMARPERGHLFARKLTDYELGLYASRGYLKAQGPIQSRAEITSHPWVGYIQDLMWTPELDYFKQLSCDIEPQIRISNVITQMMAVLGAVGLGMLPCFMAAREPELVRLLADEVRIFRSYWMVTHADVRELARVRTAVDFIVDRVQAEHEVFLPAGGP
jgi:DNA-binding transcriptional LysR family regulator